MVDGVQARMPKNSYFNNGNVQYELLIQPTTTISNLGYYEPVKTVNDIPKEIKIADVMNVGSERISKLYFYLSPKVLFKKFSYFYAKYFINFIFFK